MNKYKYILEIEYESEDSLAVERTAMQDVGPIANVEVLLDMNAKHKEHIEYANDNQEGMEGQQPLQGDAGKDMPSRTETLGSSS